MIEQEGHRYPVVIGEGLIESLPELITKETGFDISRAVVVTSPTVDGHYAESLSSLRAAAKCSLLVDDGEEAKTLTNLNQILDAFSANRLRRGDFVVAVGGGVIGDLVGFAASVYLRGIALIHVPTTLLAQVDSSVGGKTGVNLVSGKNLAGTFHYPAAVLTDVAVLSTLAPEQTRSGMFEALKSGVISDPELFELVASRDPSSSLAAVVERSIRVKGAIVASDPREGDRRRLLNYGHTLGHALEAALGYGSITHGEAVGWGMLAANAIASSRGLLSDADRTRIDQAILQLQPRPAAVSAEAILGFVDADKKFDSTKKVMVLPTAIGECAVFEDITFDELHLGASQMTA